MFGIDEKLDFIPIRIAILTVSDTRDLTDDTSGALLVERIEGAGHILAAREIVRDDMEAIRNIIKSWVASSEIDAVITTGGTGLTGRDVTPEAIRPLFDKEIEGFATVFHQVSFGTVGLSTLQARPCAGLIEGKIIFLLPGSRGAVKDGWDNILKYELDARYQPCNLVELMPRMTER